MEPVALTDPSGDVRAWMCGRCKCIGEFNGMTDGWHAEESKRSATQCCLCECGAFIGNMAFECAECSKKRAARETLAIYEAFLTGIASCIRARLVSRAMDAVHGHTIIALHEPESGPMYRVAATYWRDIGGWSVSVDRRESEGALVTSRDRRAICGTPEDTAAEVVDTLLRLAAEWSER